MKSLVNPQDPFGMNWLGEHTEWGTVRAVDGITVSKGRKLGNNIIKEQYVFRNDTNREIFLREGDLAIYTPFRDSYEDVQTCLEERCHTHVWCGGEVSYVCALRMGDVEPHLGLCLTAGSLCSYSFEREGKRGVHDRGDLLLNVTPRVLKPEESICIEWVIFWHKGKHDFYKKLENFTNYVRVEADKYVLYEGETLHLRIKAMTPVLENEIYIERFYKPHTSVCRKHPWVDEGPAVFTMMKGIACIDQELGHCGEYEYRIRVGEVNTLCRVFVSPVLEELSAKRCAFIVNHQQYQKQGSHLNGAYLIYDNEEQQIFYQNSKEYNAGRERLGMGILLARYLQEHVNEEVAASLSGYLHFVTHELVNTSTGEVYGDAGCDNTRDSVETAPWAARFFMEIYRFSGNNEFLKMSMRIMHWYYDQGGAEHYAVAVPMSELIECLEKAGMRQDSLYLLGQFKEHADWLMENGVKYESEEHFDQKMAAAAANDLLELYAITGKKKCLEAAEDQLTVLELFGGRAPDHRLYETALRYGENRRVGKRQVYGDTLPNPSSVLTGMAYLKYARILEHKADLELDLVQKQFKRKAYAALRSPLSLFFEDGSAGCAYLYPYAVDGRPEQFTDPYANDQDWVLYFLQMYEES